MKRTGTVVIVVLTVVMVGSALGYPSGSEDLLQQARRAFYAGDYAEAEGLWQQIREIEGYEWEANFFLGMIYLRQDALDEAIEQMSAAYELRPDHYYTLVNYARILYRSSELERAREILEQVPEKMRRHNEQYYNLRGLVTMARRDLPRAVELLSVAAEINPENFYVQNNLGLALIRLGDFEQAQKHLEQAAAQQPPKPYVYNNLGISYENLNQLQAAQESYERALELDPDYKRARMNLERVTAKLQE